MMLRSALLLSILSSSYLAVQTPQRGERRYQHQNLVIEGLGACSESPEKIRCWDMDGNDAPDLAEIVGAHYIMQPYSKIEYRFGKKNRLLVVRVAGQGPWSADLNYKSGRTQSFSLNESSENMTFIRTVESPVATTADLPYTLRNIRSPAYKLLKMEKGANTSLGSAVYTFQSITTSPKQELISDTATRMQTRKMYRITLSRTSHVEFAYYLLSALDKEERKISSVDANGSPQVAPLNENNHARVQYAGESPDGREIFLDTNVNPAHLGAIQLGKYETMQLVLAGFPLDPKVSS